MGPNDILKLYNLPKATFYMHEESWSWKSKSHRNHPKAILWEIIIQLCNWWLYKLNVTKSGPCSWIAQYVWIWTPPCNLCFYKCMAIELIAMVPSCALGPPLVDGSHEIRSIPSKPLFTCCHVGRHVDFILARFLWSLRPSKHNINSFFFLFFTIIWLQN